MSWGSPRRWGEDIAGQAHDHLTCISFSHVENNRTMWDVRCACGQRLKLSKPHFHKFKSCGCKRYHGKPDGRSHHPLYGRWHSMIQRCQSPDAVNFDRYGARGISVCRRWEKFENFLADMGPTFKPGLTLDRINGNKGYSKANCRWATYAEQMRNARSTLMVSTPWGRMCIKDAAAKVGIKAGTLQHRYHAGWHPSLLFAPVQNGGDRRSPSFKSKSAGGSNRRFIHPPP